MHYAGLTKLTNVNKQTLWKRKKENTNLTTTTYGLTGDFFCRIDQIIQ